MQVKVIILSLSERVPGLPCYLRDKHAVPNNIQLVSYHVEKKRICVCVCVCAERGRSCILSAVSPVPPASPGKAPPPSHRWCHRGAGRELDRLQPAFFLSFWCGGDIFF